MWKNQRLTEHPLPRGEVSSTRSSRLWPLALTQCHSIRCGLRRRARPATSRRSGPASCPRCANRCGQPWIHLVIRRAHNCCRWSAGRGTAVERLQAVDRGGNSIRFWSSAARRQTARARARPCESTPHTAGTGLPRHAPSVKNRRRAFRLGVQATSSRGSLEGHSLRLVLGFFLAGQESRGQGIDHFANQHFRGGSPRGKLERSG